jgi:hypothetical protein
MARLDCTGVTAVPIRSDSTYSLIRMGRSTVSRPSLTLVSALFLFLVLTSAGLAADIYVAQNAAGGDTGGDCTNAHSAAWFNTAGNWGTMPGQIGPGTTVHLCGTFTAASPNTTMLTVLGSGTAGNPITILFETDAQLTSPAWSANGAINLNSKSYIILDGGSNGSIVATANGTGLTYQQATSAIRNPNSGAASDITIKNFTISNIYHYLYDGSDVSSATASQCVLVQAVTDNILIYNNTMTQCGQAAIDITAAGSATTTNWQVYGNDLSQAVWLIDISGAGSSLFQNVLIHDNNLHDYDQYWDTADYMHGDPIFVRAPVSGSSYSGVYIYNNSFYGNATTHTTGYIFFSYNGSGASYVFNNTFRFNQNVASNGSIAAQWNGCGTIYVYNNTFDGTVGYPADWNRASLIGTSGGSGTPNTVVWKNNLHADLAGFNLSQGTLTSDYNVWFHVSLAPSYPIQAFYTNSTYYYYQPSDGSPNWTGLGYDTHSTASSADPKLTSSDQLQAGSSAIGAGTNLTSLCNSDPNLVPLCSDKAGRPRPASGAWDAGAYEYVSATTPNPPSNLKVTSVQ